MQGFPNNSGCGAWDVRLSGDSLGNVAQVFISHPDCLALSSPFSLTCGQSTLPWYVQ